MVAVASSQGPEPSSGWAAMRPVLVGFLLLADAAAVVALVTARPRGWVAPLIAFGVLLVGLIWFWGWAMRHRRDDR